MRDIHKLYYELKREKFEELYQARFHSESCVHVGLQIKPMSQPNKYELYYIPTNDMLQQIAQVYKMSKEFNQAISELPPVAQEQFINECLVEELYQTNELEGVKSTREEIATSTKHIKLFPSSKERFASMIKSYLRILNNDINLPKHPEDLRRIYDEITQGEIKGEELPDGEIFRTDVTYVKSGSGKVIHLGTTPESKIIGETAYLLTFMNEQENVPMLIKVAIGHYYFGYIHPFYDGNGRTSRFISSLYLAQELDNMAALSLSRACYKYKSKYYEAFEITNSIRSRGEMNYFIDSFLAMLANALHDMRLELLEKQELLTIAVQKLRTEPKLANKTAHHLDIMFVLAQSHFFTSNKGLTIKELAGTIGLSAATVRKIIKDLQALALINQYGERPAFYHIPQQYFEA